MVVISSFHLFKLWDMLSGRALSGYSWLPRALYHFAVHLGSSLSIFLTEVFEVTSFRLGYRFANPVPFGGGVLGEVRICALDISFRCRRLRCFSV